MNKVITFSPSSLYQLIGFGFGNTSEYKYTEVDYVRDFIKYLYYYMNEDQLKNIIEKLKKIKKLDNIKIEDEKTELNNIINNNPIIKKNKKLKQSIKKINIKSKKINKSVNAISINKDIVENVKILHTEVDKQINKINSNNSINLKDKKEKLEKLDHVKKEISTYKKLAKKKVWCSNGINNEEEARLYLISINPTYKLRYDNKPQTYKYYNNELNKFNYLGRNDGIITTEENTKYILEIKAVNKIKEKMPLSYTIQTLIYTKMFNIDNIIYLQKSDNDYNIKYYNNYSMSNNNKRIWNVIIKRTNDYADLINKCLSNDDLLFNIIKNKSYNELVNYLEWLD